MPTAHRPDRSRWELRRGVGLARECHPAPRRAFDYTPRCVFVGGTFWPAWSDNSNSTGDNPDATLHQFDLYAAKVPIP